MLESLYPNGFAHSKAPHSDGTEEQRVKRAKSGDKLVWEEWFNAYYPRLFRYAYIRLRRKPEAEDVVAQVFVEAFKGIQQYTYTGKPLLAWLYRIARNIIYDKQKADMRRASIAVEDEEAVLNGPDEDVSALDLARAVELLDEEQRQIITLRYFLSMSAQEAAQVTGKTPAAVFSLQARALVNLRKRLLQEQAA